MPSRDRGRGMNRLAQENAIEFFDGIRPFFDDMSEVLTTTVNGRPGA